MNQPVTASPRPSGPKELQKQIKHAFDKVQAYLLAQGNERLQTHWTEWKQRFTEIFERTKLRPEVAISLVGGTGAGKSTLLNALIGARVLPVSNMRACTAAICEVAYGDGGYAVRIEFVSRESWEREVSLLLADLRDARSSPGEDGDGGDVAAQMSRSVRDKLWAVYRQSEGVAPASFDPFTLVEPPEIKQSLDRGFVEFRSSDLSEFRQEVARYLDSQHRFWPIVKTVSIRGPFSQLRDGAKIIDLPGINDPNEAREEVTKNHLKTCRFVWLVFNIKRALTRDAINLMQSDDFLRQVVMDGRADSLTFVGTAADDVDQETGIEEFRLSGDSAITDVVHARNRAVRDVVLTQLDELAFRLGTMAREHRETAAKLAARLKDSKIFTVSAREYLRLTGLAKTNSAGFESIGQTEVPQLVDHMRHICEGYGIPAHCASLSRQLEMLLAEIKREVQSQQAILRSRAEVSQRGREEIKVAVESARSFLDRDLDDARERLVQALEADQSLLGERVRRAVERAKHDLDQTCARWDRMHWATIKAVCRRSGSHTGSSGKNDFPADLSKPILDGIAFAWSDFFGERLRQTLEKWTSHLLRQADNHRTRLTKSLSSVHDVSSNAASSLSDILETTEKVLNEILAQTAGEMETKIQREQRTLYESVPQQVKANMQQAFVEAAKESGSGMKKRMVETLARHAQEVSQVMFDDARDAILNGVRGLNDWLAREYDKMTGAVSKHASLAAEHLVVSGHQQTAQSIEVESASLEGLMNLVIELEGASA